MYIMGDDKKAIAGNLPAIAFLYRIYLLSINFMPKEDWYLDLVLKAQVVLSGSDWSADLGPADSGLG
jgi:hypothetical protein